MWSDALPGVTSAVAGEAGVILQDTPGVHQFFWISGGRGILRPTTDGIVPDVFPRRAEHLYNSVTADFVKLAETGCLQMSIGAAPTNTWRNA